MATKTTKKSTLTKRNPTKKVETKETSKQEKVQTLATEVKSVAEKTTTTPKAQKKEETTIKKTEFGATPLSHTLFVVMTVLLWTFLTAFVVLELNYEVTIEPKEVVAQRIERRRVRMQQEMLQMRKDQRKTNVRRKKVRSSNSAQQRERMERYLEKNGGPILVARVENVIKVAQEPEVEAKAVKEDQEVQKPQLKLAKRNATFVESEYAPYAGTGHAIIEGNACFELSDGTKKCFEDADVFINPVTSYSDEWYNRGWVGNEFLAKADERVIAYNKMIKTGKDGAFKFSDLKPGSYYVGVKVCLPDTQDGEGCSCTRYASKVTMKNRVKTTLKKVFPVQ